MELDIGVVVSDLITGFKGRVTGLVRYISGCNQALVTPQCGQDGHYVDAQWFDVQRLKVDETQAVLALSNGATPGADQPAPKR